MKLKIVDFRYAPWLEVLILSNIYYIAWILRPGIVDWASTVVDMKSMMRLQIMCVCDASTRCLRFISPVMERETLTARLRNNLSSRA